MSVLRAVLLLGVTIATSTAGTRVASADTPPSPTASPSPAPSASARAVRNARPQSPPERLAIATCSRTYFYNWPIRDAAPSGANYPPATNGDAFHLIGEPQLSYGGKILIETTIDVVEPWGAGKHYWVAGSCVSDP